MKLLLLALVAVLLAAPVARASEQHPSQAELEGADAELRAGPLNWVGRYLEAGVRMVPLNKAGHDVLKYKESRVVGYEADGKGDEKKETRPSPAPKERKRADESKQAESDRGPAGKADRLSREGCSSRAEPAEVAGRLRRERKHSRR